MSTEPNATGPEQDRPPATVVDGVIAELRKVYDPEVPVNIYDMGLIYDVAVDEAGQAKIRMTLTSPACPVAGTLPRMAELAAKSAPGVESAKVELVWDPPWTPELMPEHVRLELGLL